MSDRARIHAGITALKADLLAAQGPRISTMRNYRFAIFQYAPDQEFEVRTQLRATMRTTPGKNSATDANVSPEYLEELAWTDPGAVLANPVLDLISVSDPAMWKNIVTTARYSIANSALATATTGLEPSVALRFALVSIERALALTCGEERSADARPALDVLWRVVDGSASFQELDLLHEVAARSRPPSEGEQVQFVSAIFPSVALAAERSPESCCQAAFSASALVVRYAVDRGEHRLMAKAVGEEWMLATLERIRKSE